MATLMEIVKYVRLPDFDALIRAYWIMFCRAPKKAEPDSDGVYDLLEIGEVRDKTWARATPYSLAQRIPE